MHICEDRFDCRYILGRDNYTCQNCDKDLSAISPAPHMIGWGAMAASPYYFKKVDTNAGHISSNIRLVCIECQGLNASLEPPPSSFSGHLTVITGSMYAEKSTITESFYNKYAVIYKDCIWVKPDIDDRETDYTKTHNNSKISALTIDSKRPDHHLDELKAYKVVAIDEIQFFSLRILHVIHELLKNSCLVIVNGLKLTAKRGIFGVTHFIMAEADEIISLKAVCNICKLIDCATRTKCYNTNAPAVSTGGVEQYYAVCAKCDGGSNEKDFIERVF